jgi:proline iminopeptidase
MKNIQTSIILLFLLFSCSQNISTRAESEGFVKIDETKLYYNITGSGDTLVVLHGGPGLSHKYLKPQLDSFLSDRFTLWYYDQRGSGWSEGVKDNTKLTMQRYITDLEAVRSHFNLSKLNLAGHSFGGLLAMYYGIAFPDNLNSLVLIDTDAACYDLRTPYQIKTINSRLTEAQFNYLASISESDDFKNFHVSAYDKYCKTFLTSYFANPNDTTRIELDFDSISIPKTDVTSVSSGKT